MSLRSSSQVTAQSAGGFSTPRSLQIYLASKASFFIVYPSLTNKVNLLTALLPFVNFEPQSRVWEVRGRRGLVGSLTLIITEFGA